MCIVDANFNCVTPIVMSCAFCQIKLGLVLPSRGNANTALQFHAGRLLALHETDMPYSLRVLCDGMLETIGSLTFDGKLQTPFAAHPKTCPSSGYMYSFGYQV